MKEKYEKYDTNKNQWSNWIPGCKTTSAISLKINSAESNLDFTFAKKCKRVF